MAKKTLLDFAEEHNKPVAPVVTCDLSGKTVVITGANAGIGFEAAKHFALMKPARLIIVCRNQERGEKAVNEIEAATGYKSELWLLDLAEFASVLEFVEKFEKDGGKIDILVANAGAVWSDYRETVDGWEQTIQVNYLSTALLCLLLLPRLQAASEDFNPRIVVVGSAGHFRIAFEEEVMSSQSILKKLCEQPERFETKRYREAKTLILFFVRSLAERLKSHRLIISCVDPGYCVSELSRNIEYKPGDLIPHTAEEGSRQLIWAAIGGEGRESELQGAYIANAEIDEPSDFVIGDQGKVAQARVWDETMEVLSKLSPKVAQVVANL